MNRPGLIVGAITSGLLVAVSGRYGYHRDELYFLACGQHLAFGYPDQPPLVPMLSRLVPGDSLVLLRLASALSAGTVVLLGALIGARLLQYLSNKILRFIFLPVIIVAALEMILHGLRIGPF